MLGRCDGDGSDDGRSPPNLLCEMIPNLLHFSHLLQDVLNIDARILQRLEKNGVILKVILKLMGTLRFRFRHFNL